MDKTEIISRIYDLRSRLGMIIMLDQRINQKKQAVQNEISNKESNIDEFAKETRHKNWKFEYSWESFYDGKAREEIEQAKERLGKILNDERWVEKQQWKKMRPRKIIAAILIALVMGTFFFFLVLFNAIMIQDTTFFIALDDQTRDTVLPGFMVITSLVFIQIIVSTILRLNFKFVCEAEKKYNRDLNAEKRIIEDNYSYKKKQIRNREDYKALVIEGEEKVKKYTTDLAIKQQKSLDNLKEMVMTKKSICVQTHKQYDDFINPADWQHLDLLIHLFETNRVTTIQEALKEVDVIQRHNQLLNTIDNVGKQIQLAIRQSINRLEERINDRLISIEQRVNFIGHTVNQRLDLMESQMEVMHRERIDAIEGLRFTMTKNSMDLSKQANEAYRSIDQELRYIALNTR